MKWKVKKSKLSGTINVPPSKSHTIRSMLVSSLANGTSYISNVLTSGDGASAISAAKNLGAKVVILNNNAEVTGIGLNFTNIADFFNMENSGTATNLFSAAVSLCSKRVWFDGDSSLRLRPFKPLLEALKNLGANFGFKVEKRDLPFWICGPIKGGKTTVNGFSSQFVSALLFSCPCALHDTEIIVENLHEKPYVEMTLNWLDRQQIKYEASRDLTFFKIYGNQHYKAFEYFIPGDFSSATFGAVAAPLLNTILCLKGLDFSDSQGDKRIFDILEMLGAKVDKKSKEAIVNGKCSLKGNVIDLNSMPDALPAISVLGCVCDGETQIVNVAQARIKETDRISVMTCELKKMGANILETKDGLIIRKSNLKGAFVNGHNDHRVVMALALAGMIADGETIIDTAESASVTYPTFYDDFKAIGANIEIIE
jgi:3-phosphoshikimate 1-carboxyvinyltransferase